MGFEVLGGASVICRRQEVAGDEDKDRFTQHVFCFLLLLLYKVINIIIVSSLLYNYLLFVLLFLLFEIF